MSKISELNKFCKTKLQLKKVENSNHTGYELRPKEKVVLPTLIRISRGSGEASSNNIRGIAKALGLTEKELKSSVQCDISKEIIYLSLSVHLLKFVFNQLLIRKNANSKGASAMISSANMILDSLFIKSPNKINKKERQLIMRLIKDLNSICQNKQLSKISNTILDILSSYVNNLKSK